jgi:hypothetical protein
MKRWAVAPLVAVFLGGAILAQAGERTGTSVTLKVGFFFPGDRVFRQVYSSGPFFGVDVAVPFTPLFRVWAGAELFGQTGHLSVSAEPSRVRVAPLFAGLRLELDQYKLRPYVGAAAAYFFVHESNPLGTASEGGLGLLSQAGIQARLGRSFLVDVHAGFRACKVHSGGDDPLSAGLGGLSLGLGLTYHF